MNSIKVVKGNVIYTEKLGEYKVVENGYIVIEDSIVQGVYKSLPNEYKNYVVKDYGNNLIIPGFVDIHLHAPQFPNMGLGLDEELIPWLEKYTFPEENKYSDVKYAKSIYGRLIKKIWEEGTTRCCVFSTIHKESTKLLFDMFNASGLGAYIGKVNMDRQCPEFLTEETEVSIKETEEIIKTYSEKYKLVKPIITPRFVPTCSFEMLKSLGELSIKYNVPVQSHLCENEGEIDLVRKLHPNEKNYTEVYNSAKLLSNKTIMAHCVWLNDQEISLIKNKGVFIAHCPTSNMNLASGISPIRNLINNGISIGLASDISGGHTLSMPEVIRCGAQASNLRWLESGRKDKALNTAELFYLATKGGGKFFGNVGSFEQGYEFDALVIDDSNLYTNCNLSIEERLQKYIYTGTCKNIIERYVSGTLLNEPNFI